MSIIERRNKALTNYTGQKRRREDKRIDDTVPMPSATSWESAVPAMDFTDFTDSSPSTPDTSSGSDYSGGGGSFDGGGSSGDW